MQSRSLNPLVGKSFLKMNRYLSGKQLGVEFTDSNINGSSIGITPQKEAIRPKKSFHSFDGIRLEGLKKFSSKKDVEAILDGLVYDKVEALVDSQLSLTGSWAVKLNDKSPSFEIFQKLTHAKRQKNKITIFNYDFNDKNTPLSLASTQGLDNTCIKVVNAGVPLDDDSVYRIFEGFNLDPHKPFRLIPQPVYSFSNRELAIPNRGNGFKYIVKFASALEAERAVIEKCFSPIGGIRTIFLWYDI